MLGGTSRRWSAPGSGGRDCLMTKGVNSAVAYRGKFLNIAAPNPTGSESSDVS